jgi:hypothetical protein
MDAVIRKQLQTLIERVDGLAQLFVTDRDGVPISVIGVAGMFHSLVCVFCHRRGGRTTSTTSNCLSVGTGTNKEIGV